MKKQLTESQLNQIICESIADKLNSFKTKASDFFTNGHSGEATNVEEALQQCHWGIAKQKGNTYDIYPNPFFGADIPELKSHMEEYLAKEGKRPIFSDGGGDYHLLMKIA